MTFADIIPWIPAGYCALMGLLVVAALALEASSIYLLSRGPRK